MTPQDPATDTPASEALLEEVQRRVLWLAVRMVDIANRERSSPDGLKVGGHQASSASMVTLMTALWFAHLRAGDRVAVKPHASPVLHAINYLLGALDRVHLRRLRSFGGLQAYPSRTKDPDPVDFSTGSVGLGAVAPVFAALTRRYLDHHVNKTPTRRFISLVGDAELDEGNVWEALVDPVTQGHGNVLWVVDLNRQSLDRVVPGIKAAQLKRLFADAGWHVAEAKYGRRLEEVFVQEGGDALRRHIDEMTNERYQGCFALRGPKLRAHFLTGADPKVARLLDDVSDDGLAPLIRNLGGHDFSSLLDAYREADAEADRPSIVFAYTIKGWGLPIAGDPLNHSAMLTGPQIDELRSAVGLTPQDELDPFPPASPEGNLCARVARSLWPPDRQRSTATPRLEAPVSVGGATRTTSTQEAFGRMLVRLSRNEHLGPRIVTASPDVAISTSLGGWINKVGIFNPALEGPVDRAADGLLRWREHPGGQHIELGISEMNLFMLLGQLGLSRELHGEPLVPIGTVYDPFVCRGLDALIYSVYSGARFIVVGTPSGITLSPEGGAHQSTVTPSIGVELPGLRFAEPAYAGALDWLLCHAVGQVLDPAGESTYLRLSTRTLDQEPFEQARARVGDDALRADVLAGGYRLLDASGGSAGGRWVVQLLASGAVMPEVLDAARELANEGVTANVIDVTALDRLHRDWRAWLRGGVRQARSPHANFHLARLLPPGERRAPIVTVHDAASHAMSWLGSVFGAPMVPVGVDAFGQSGTITDLYTEHDLSSDAIVNAALLALAANAAPSPAYIDSTPGGTRPGDLS